MRAALSGKSAQMAIIVREADEPYSYKTDTADIKGIANVEKVIPQEWIINDGTYVSEEFIKYAKPLIMGEVEKITKNGLPVHLKIK